MAKKLPLKFDRVRKQLFVQNMALRLSPSDAAREAGFTSNAYQAARQLLEDEEVKEMLADFEARQREFYDTSRTKILKDLVDAKEMARVQGDVKAMVFAIQPIIDIEGYKAPQQLEVKRIDVHGPQLRRQIREVPDGELLRLAHEEGFEAVDLLPAIDAEFVEVEDEQTDP